MISKFFASIIANVSEELLTDLFRAIVKEYAHKRKKADIHKTVNDLKAVLDEVAKDTELSDDEKNARLIGPGRAVVERLRKP